MVTLSTSTRASAIPSAASHCRRDLYCRIEHFVFEWRFFRHADVLQMAPDVVIGRRTVFGEQSGDGMRRLGHVETIVPAPDPLRCGNLSMLRTTTPRRAMMDA